MSDDPWETETETYYKVIIKDGRDNAAAFSNKEAAEEIAERFNERYESEYEVVEADDATAQELMKGITVSAVEGI